MTNLLKITFFLQIFLILVPVKSCSQELNKTVLKSVIYPYFNKVDTSEYNVLLLKHELSQDTIKVKKSNTKWYVRLGKGCLFSVTGLYLGWKISENTNIMSGKDEGEAAYIFSFCFAGAAFVIGLLL